MAQPLPGMEPDTATATAPMVDQSELHKPGLTQAQTNRAFGGTIAHEVAPSAAALLASMFLGPEAGLGIRGLTGLRVSPWLVRSVLAGGAGTAGELGVQGVMREPLDVNKALSRGIGEGVAQGAGEGLSGLVSAGGRNLYRGALRPSARLTDEAISTQTRLQGIPVTADVADISAQGLRERLPVGRVGSGPAGTEILSRRTVPMVAQKDAGIRAAQKAKWKLNPQRLAAGVDELKAELATEVGGKEKLALVDELWSGENGFLSDYRITTYPSGKPRPGAPKIKPMTAAELDNQVLRWQQQADYNRAAADPREALRARLAKALARAGRAELRGIDTPIGNGRTAGDLIGQANDALSNLHPLREALQDAEVRSVSGSGGGSVPWWLHAGAPAAGAMAGAGHGPAGVGTGALLGLLADRALAGSLSNPAIASRAGLAMTAPAAPTIARQTPRAIIELIRLLSAASAPRDATLQPQGVR